MEHLRDMIALPLEQYPDRICVKFFDGENVENRSEFTYREVLEISRQLEIVLRSEIGGSNVISVLFNIDQCHLACYVPCVVAITNINCAFHFVKSLQLVSEEMNLIGSELILTESEPPENFILLKTVHIKNGLKVNVLRRRPCFVSTPSSVPRQLDTKDDIAYVITTSGTTGQVKTVHATQASVVPNIRDMMAEFRPQPGDVIMMAAPPTFDPAIVDVFLALSSGK